MIVLGTHLLYVSQEQSFPRDVVGVKLGLCEFGEERTGALMVAPHHEDGLALLLLGNSLSGLWDAVSLTTPTIPPMTRSPVRIPNFAS